MMISKNNLKLKFFERYFKYEYDSENYKLKLLIDEKDNELRDFEKTNFRKIMMLKDEIITLEDNSFIWYVKSCDHSFANEIVFTIEYAIELYNNDSKYSSIELKSIGLSSLLHPSNYFYHNKEASKSDVLYDVIKMKKFKFNFDNEEVQACVYIGNLLNRGILSNLTNDIILSLKFSETKNILKICKMIDHARTSLRILSYSNLFQ
jgi:hypothetical protein